MRKLALAVLFLLSLSLAADLHEGGWVFSTGSYGGGTVEIIPTLSYDGGLTLKLESSSRSRALFKLFNVFDTPTNGTYQIEFDARVIAPGIDLDFNKQFPTGEGVTNDGPNLFAFAYSYENSTLGALPVPMETVTFYDKYNSLCHVHMECNYVGALDVAYDFYCRSPRPELLYAGWVYDAKTFGGAVKENDVSAEAFPDNGWKKVRLFMDPGECASKRTTLMLMGVDALGDKEYSWEIRNVKVIAADETPLTFDYVYSAVGGSYDRVAKPVYCGDGEKAASEECDGAMGVEEGWLCTDDCKLKSICGDSKLVGTEVCDALKHKPGYTCASNCSMEIPACGDAFVVPGEVCDGTNVTSGFRCSPDCKSMGPVCGDNIIVGAEECDGTNGTTAESGCTQKCTTYRILSEGEQESMDSLLSLIDSAKPGIPSLARMSIARGTYGSKDFADQLALRNKTLAGNVSFCATGMTVCEARYIFVEDARATAAGLAPTDTLTGVAKAYRATVNNSTRYYIGFKGGAGALPYIEMDTTMLIIIGVLIVLIVGAGIVLLLLVGGYVYFNKGAGIGFKHIFK